ncbi:MAG: hypothetical protein B7X60_06265 [Polynucleobacter sp. 39-45-136]|nr:MAG: hypothetical protein B7X60_06265 [Polynucleobacter sp. 39-45-136]
MFWLGLPLRQPDFWLRSPIRLVAIIGDIYSLYSSLFALFCNMLMVLVIGYQIAGLIGAVVVLLSFFLPSSFLCFYVGRLWNRFGENPWRRSIQNALEPISIGLMASGVYAVGKASVVGGVTAALALITFYLILRTKINPVLVILGSGGLGALLILYLK